MSKDCKRCGACKNHDPCDCCGACRKCGRYPSPLRAVPHVLPYVRHWPLYVEPTYIPAPFWCSETVTWSADTVVSNEPTWTVSDNAIPGGLAMTSATEITFS